MALIAKIDAPLTVAEDGVAQIHARPYQKQAIESGDEVFVWTSKMSGGHGLAARGTVLASRIESIPNADGAGTHKELVIDVRMVGAAPLRALHFDKVAKLRDSNARMPKASPSTVVFNHALNKITSIESDVADFVRSHFEEQ